MPYVLSAYFGHDASVAVVGHGQIVHLESERFTRTKHGTQTHVQARELIGKALELAHANVDDVVCFAGIGCAADFGGQHVRPYWEQQIAVCDGPYLTRFFDLERSVHYVPHHLAHAAYSFYTSPFEQAGVVAIDGGGDAWRNPADNQICIIDTALGSAAHRFGSTRSEWTMHVRPSTCIGGAWENMGIRLFNQSFAAGTVMALCGIEDNFAERTGFDASIQAEIRALQDRTDAVLMELGQGPFPVCMSGGVALNGIATHACLRQPNGPSAIYTPPAVHDGGLTIGAALYVLHRILNEPRRYYSPETVAFAGYTEPELEGELPVGEMVDALIAGQVVAVANGRAESGPRALGHRSFLADPRNLAMRDRLNVIKGRQPFRPTAPVILREFVEDYFETINPDCYPFMTMICQGKARAKVEMPAGLHLDGSARLQTVHADSPLGKVLVEFQARTGVPALLNTSFNLKGEPLVNTAEQARETWGRSGADMLVVGSKVITRAGIEREKAEALAAAERAAAEKLAAEQAAADALVAETEVPDAAL